MPLKNSQTTYDVIVIGAGAAGLIAAGHAAQQGVKAGMGYAKC